MTVDVEDGVAKTPASKGDSEAARADICIVIDPEDDFVTKGQGGVNGSEDVRVKVEEGVRGSRTRGAGCREVLEVLGPHGAASVG